MKNEPTPLPAHQQAAIASLRHQMGQACCVFEFTVRQLPYATPVGDEQHRAVLAELFHEMSEIHDLAQARASEWSTDCMQDTFAWTPHRSNWLAALSQAFSFPPYGCHGGAELFVKFCDAVGLLPGQKIEVWDWVGNPDANPGRSAWSNYFDAGKQWWGIWCLTVWNPQRRTLSALAASTTD